MYNASNIINDPDINNDWISDYDIMCNFNGECKIETKIFTTNLEYITIMDKNDHFFGYIHEFTYNLFDFTNIIYHSWIWELNDGLYAKFYVPQGTSPLLKTAIFLAWIKYTENPFPNSVKIYEDYCGTLYECDDYKETEPYFYKELLKIMLDKDMFNQPIFQEVLDKLTNLATNI
jgi:hypothetical protein